MKKIYTFTLGSEDYPSEKFRYDLRLFAYWMYDKLYNYYGDGFIPLNLNNNIKYNAIHEGIKRGEYYLDSDIFDDGYIYYEPFLIGERSFGLTVIDDSIDEKTLQDLIKEVLSELQLDYSVIIGSACYCSKSSNDESQRRKAISLVYNNLRCEMPARNIILGFSKKRILNRGYGENFMRVSGR